MELKIYLGEWNADLYKGKISKGLVKSEVDKEFLESNMYSTRYTPLTIEIKQ